MQFSYPGRFKYFFGALRYSVHVTRQTRPIVGQTAKKCSVLLKRVKVEIHGCTIQRSCVLCLSCGKIYDITGPDLHIKAVKIVVNRMLGIKFLRVFWVWLKFNGHYIQGVVYIRFGNSRDALSTFFSPKLYCVISFQWGKVQILNNLIIQCNLSRICSITKAIDGYE